LKSACFFLKNKENILYNWANLWYHQKAGVMPDAIIMPVAQLWEKAVFSISVHHPPLLGYWELFMKGGNFP